MLPIPGSGVEGHGAAARHSQAGLASLNRSTAPPARPATRASPRRPAAGPWSAPAAETRLGPAG